ncbi:MAG: DUF4136 domain-containing protein [Pseudomonadales bacterium]|jgi:hypothetical protein|nr:DUF4136 domain-containing protein [Pseudomonadales bacterium]
MNIWHRIRTAALVGVALLLSACVSSIRSDVLTFHEGPLPAGEAVRVVALDPVKQNSLEFQSYARLVEAELRKIGYQPSTDANAPLIAALDYSVAPYSTTVSSMGGRGPRPFFARYHFSYGRYYDPFYFGLYNDWGPSSYTTTPNYLRTVTLNIERNDADRERLFEGRVQSSGRQNLLPELMPYLLTALFQNYPGESGVTKVVTIEQGE